MASSTTKLGPFVVGIDNRVRDYALKDPRTGVTAVRDAVNVDLSVTGQFTRRGGHTQVLAGSRLHSLWSNDHETFCIQDGALCRYTPPATTTPILTGLSPVALGCYCNVPGRGIAFSNGQVIKRITADGVLPFALEQPSTPATVSATSGGALLAGFYEVAVTFADALGQESGGLSSEYVEVVGDGNGKIVVGLPRPFNVEAVTTRIYCSARNSAHNYLVGTVPSSQATFEVTLIGGSTRRLSTEFMLPLPAGDMLAFHDGRTYSHLNGIVYFTQPWSSQHQPFSDYFAFPEPLTIMAAIAGGMYFVADKTYFLPGQATIEGNLRVVADTRAVRRTLITLPDSEDVLWFTPRGLVRASQGGKLDFLQDDHVAVRSAASGAALYREQDGLHQVITSLREPGVSSAGARSWFTVKMGSRETRNDF